MAVRTIFTIGDEVLRKHAKPVETIDKRIKTLLDDMAQTMYAADGAGLAAPQVGILRRVVTIDVGEGLIELINPQIISQEGSQVGPEGCLSIPGRRCTHGSIGIISSSLWKKPLNRRSICAEILK